ARPVAQGWEQLCREPATRQRARAPMESGVLRNEREPEAPAPSGRVHRESGRPPPLRGDLTLIWMGRGMATLSRFRFPTPEAWARYHTALQAQCFTGPALLEWE